MDSVIPHGLDGPLRTLPNRRTLVKGAAWAAPTLVIATTAPAVAASSPSDNCYPVDTLFDAQARGRLLSGAIGGVNLDSVASIEGVHARAFQGTANADSHRDTNGLTVTALDAIELELGGLGTFVSEILNIVAAQDSGVVNQYAFASAASTGSDTADLGASGAVGSDGAITLDAGSPEPPALGTIDLRSILAQATGDGVADLVSTVTDLTLDIGAAAARTEMDSLCIEPEDDSELSREYYLAYLRLLAKSDTVSALGETLNSVSPITLGVSLDAVREILDSLPLVGSLFGLEVTATLDARPLTGTLPNDPDAALRTDLESGEIEIDVASLLGGAFDGSPSEWLNSRSPNTRLFVDAGIPGEEATSLADTWVSSLLDALGDVVAVDVRVPLGLLTIRGTLNELLAGEATTGGLARPVLREAGKSIGAIVKTALETLLSENAALASAMQAVNSILASLFSVLSGILAITVNAQNDASGTVPSYYQSITPAGRYDVAALHVQVLGAVRLLDLSVARGSVGNNVPRAQSQTNGVQLPF